LSPNDSITLELNITKPTDTDVTLFEVDLVDQGITWFADHGSKAVKIELKR
jgi:hypothetical protein